MSKNISARQISDHPVSNEIEKAVSEVLQSQPWYERRKNSLFALGQLVLQAANFGTVFLVGAPWYIAVIVGVLISGAEILTHSRTKGPVTPSGAQRIVETYAREISDRADKLGVPVWNRPE